MPERKHKEIRLGKWRSKAVPFTASDPESAARVLPMKYRTFEDPLFPGVWRVEPVDYTGRGIVYLFHDVLDAHTCVRRKNKEYADSIGRQRE